MKNNFLRVLSMLLFFMMLCSFLPMLPVTAAQTDSKVIDFSSEEAFESNAFTYRHIPTETQPDPYTGGRYAFSDTNGAMQILLQRTANQAPYRLMFGFTSGKGLNDDYKYMVVVWAADTQLEYRMTMWNSPKYGNEIVIASSGKDTGGKWNVSEPLDISASSTSQSVLTRFGGGSHNTLSIKTDDANARFYIKEIRFFKSADAAKSYYAGVSFPALSDEAVSDGSSDFPRSAKTVEKNIISFRTKDDFLDKGFFYSHTPSDAEPDPNTGGVYSFSEEKQALKLDYSANSKYGPYRVMTHLSRAALTADYKYFTVVYSIKSSSDYTMTLWNGGHWGKEAVIIKSAAPGNGEWTVSDPMDISAVSSDDKSVLTRWMKGSFNYLQIKCADKNAEVYIKEFGFFKSAEDAKLYYSEADVNRDPSEYELTEDEKKFGILPDVLPEPVIMDFSGSSADLSKNTTTVKFGGARQMMADGKYAMKIAYSPSKSMSAYRMLTVFNSEDALTKYHQYVRVTYMSNESSVANLAIADTSGSGKMTLTANISASDGRFVTTNAIKLTSTDVVSDLNAGNFCWITSSCANSDAGIYIREIAFFASAEQAYAHYGDSYVPESVVEYSGMFFGDEGNAAYLEGEQYGVHEENLLDGTLDISHAPSTNIAGTSYLAKIKFQPTHREYEASSRYVRILYKAQNPDGAKDVILRLRNDKSGSDYVDFDRDVQTTDGFVLTGVEQISQDMAERFAGSGAYKGKLHNSVYFMTTLPGGIYQIKGIYFFNTEEEALAFTPPLDAYKLTVNGNDISKYTVVVGSCASEKTLDAADTLVTEIKKLTGITLKTVTDSTPPSPCEIIVGETTRAESAYYYGDGGIYNTQTAALGAYAVRFDENKIIFAANNPYGANAMIEAWCDAYLNDALAKDGTVSVDSKSVISGSVSNITKTSWAQGANVADPYVFTEDFSSDDGYFTENNGDDRWSVSGGIYQAKLTPNALSYVHVFERNVRYTAKLRVDKTTADSDAALVLRYNADHAYVRAGYDFNKGVWYIEERSGDDFRALRLAEKKGEFKPGTAYTLEFTVNGADASLSVNGNAMLSASGLVHVTPGQIGVYANNCTAALDDVSAILMSGEGVVWQNALHTKLPDNVYREGGTVVEMRDGTLNYVHSSGTAFKSLDDGATWQRSETWATTTSYPNIFRLANGDLIKTQTETVNGVSSIVSMTSSDEGKTWVQGGVICPRVYHRQATMSASYMNDKLTQTSSGRIFYAQNYQDQKSTAMDGYIQVFCEFYYSDDNGKTWTKSETDSYEIEGNGSMGYFGECKIIETSDGLRMYNSWSDYDYVVYSDSYDNGITWGPLNFAYELPTGRASMQIVRDEYSDTMCYYMLLVYNNVNRSRLSLFESEDGKSWEFLGDVWRWEAEYKNDGALFAHIVDPFIKTTEGYIICGSGLSERTGNVQKEGGTEWHQAQRQHVYSIKKDTLPEGSTPTRFTDVPAAQEYSTAVAYVNAKGLFTGTSDTTFSPDTTMTRSMFVTVLGRLDGADTAKYQTPTFKDVKAGQWYTAYVEWAAANGVVNGIGNGLYGIDGNVTVEQACVMLARYAGNKAAVKASGKTVSDFADTSAISAWAADGVKWAVENGVYTGSGASLNPTANASRAVVATMFYNYVTVFGE